MKILITGGAGFIGTHLTKKLVWSNHSVRILDNLLRQVHGDNPDYTFTDCEFIKGDVRDNATVNAAMEGIDVVYHLAAETGVGQSQYEVERYVSTNTHGTAVVLQAAARAKVRQVVIASSRAVYGDGMHFCTSCDSGFAASPRKAVDLDKADWEVHCPVCSNVAESQLMKETHNVAPTSVYGLTKLQQEQISQQVHNALGLSVTLLRFFNVYGPGQSLSNPYVGVLGTFFRRIIADSPIDIYEDGKMRRDFVYIDDIVGALHLVAGNATAFNKTLNIGSGEEITLEQAGKAMFSVLHKEPKVEFSGRYRLGDIHHAVADIDLAKREIGYSPTVSFHEGLSRFVEWARVNNTSDATIDNVAEKKLTENNLLRRAGSLSQ